METSEVSGFYPAARTPVKIGCPPLRRESRSHEIKTTAPVKEVASGAERVHEVVDRVLAYRGSRCRNRTRLFRSRARQHSRLSRGTKRRTSPSF